MFSAAEKAEQGGRQRGVTGSRARTGVATRLPPDAGRPLGLQPVGNRYVRVTSAWYTTAEIFPAKICVPIPMWK